MIPTKKTVIPSVEVVELGAPVYAQIELTGNCQYSCPFCYNIWRNGERQTVFPNLSREQAFAITDELISLKIFSVILSGGEPTLMKYLPDLVRHFTNAGVDVTMITNGALLTKDLAEKLADAGLESVQVSMHHHIPEKFDELVDYSGAHDATLNGIRNAIAALGVGNVNVNMVITPDTLNAIDGMLELLSTNGVEFFSTSLVSSCRNGERLALGSNLTTYVYNKLLPYSDRMQLAFVGGMPFCSLPENYDASKVKMANVCDAAMAQVVIGPDGGIRPCVEWPQSGGNIFTDSLKDVWVNSEVFQSIRRYENTPIGCHTCAAVAFCHGGCRAAALSETGDIQGNDPLMPIIPITSIEGGCSCSVK